MVTCPVCKGGGILEMRFYAMQEIVPTQECFACGGKGTIVDHPWTRKVVSELKLLNP